MWWRKDTLHLSYHICNQDIRFGSFAHFQKCFFWCLDYYLLYILYSIFCRAKIILKFALSSFDEPKPIALVRFAKKKSKTIFQKYFCIVNINILCAMCLKAIRLLVILCSDIVHWTAKEWGPCIKFNQIKGLLYLLGHLNNIIVMLFSNIYVT